MKIIKNQWKPMRINGNSSFLMGFHEKVLPGRRLRRPTGVATTSVRCSPKIPTIMSPVAQGCIQIEPGWSERSQTTGSGL